MTKLKQPDDLYEQIMTSTFDTTVNYLTTEHGTKIAWSGQVRPGRPTFIFFAGHGSDMHGTKAIAVDEWARENDYGIVRFDYFGHGQSSGEYLDGTISLWRKDCLAVIDHLTEGEIIIIGSSLGGWLMMLAARDRMDRIAGLIGIAAAPDFTDDLIWDELSDDQKNIMQEQGKIALPNPYAPEDVIYPYSLVEDGRNNFVLRDRQEAPFPVRLLHGMQDEEVPFTTAEKLAKNLDGDDVQVILVEDAGHRFSSPEQIDILLATLGEVTLKAGLAD